MHQSVAGPHLNPPLLGFIDVQQRYATVITIDYYRFSSITIPKVIGPRSYRILLSRSRRPMSRSAQFFHVVESQRPQKATDWSKLLGLPHKRPTWTNAPRNESKTKTATEQLLTTSFEWCHSSFYICIICNYIHLYYVHDTAFKHDVMHQPISAPVPSGNPSYRASILPALSVKVRCRWTTRLKRIQKVSTVGSWNGLDWGIQPPDEIEDMT